MKYPLGMRYSRDHEWVRLEGNQATIGVTHYGQASLGEVVSLELPTVGQELKEHEPFGVARSKKSGFQLLSPLAGRIVEVDADLVRNPSLINRDPHGAAWMIRVELTEPKRFKFLMNGADYRRYVESLK